MGSAEPILGAPRALKLKPSSYLLLGMVRFGARSGYAIKKATDVSTRAFWPTSLAQVYPELARLEDAGLLERRDDPHGGRTRSAYELTEQGQEALLAWLLSTREAQLQFRDEGVLRLFFADALQGEDQLELVRRLRARAHGAATQMRNEVVPLAETLTSGGLRFPAIVARLGADMYAYAEEWLTQVEAELQRPPAST